MHAIKLLQKCLLSALEPMHMRRRESLLGSVAALIDGRRLVLMDLARSWPGRERVAAPLSELIAWVMKGVKSRVLRDLARVKT